MCSLMVAYDTPFILGFPDEFSCCRYTELADTENEINGVITYDRKVFRYDPAALSRIHNHLISAGMRL